MLYAVCANVSHVAQHATEQHDTDEQHVYARRLPILLQVLIASTGSGMVVCCA